MTPRAFLEILWQYKREEQYILIWTGQDKRSRWFQDAAAAAEYVESDACRGKCVFVGIGSSKTDNGPTHRCTSDEIASICAVWTDLDLKGEAHKGKALPGTVDDAISILPKDMPPTITVATGNGAHAWWVFKEALTFDTADDRKHAVEVLNRWHTMIRLRCAARGWVYERLSDLARVARVPGTFNMKDPAKPKPVTVIATTDRRYDLSDFQEYVDDAGIPGTEAQERAASEWAERFKDKPLVINPSARIPQETLDAWMDPANSDRQTAARFRNTWERRRHDLKDPSQSGYDLALADFGVMAGLAEQQIVDLICHHRSIHSQKQRTREDYFQRTLARAMERNPDAPQPADAPPTTGLAAPPGAHVAPEGQEATDTTSQPPAAPAPPMSEEDAKAMLCAEISKTLGIPIAITRLVKIKGKDPSYRMELADETKIEFPTIAKFRTQEVVCDEIAKQIDWYLPRMKAKKWDEIKQHMLNACFTEEGPIEAQWEDSTVDIVVRYLEQNQFIEDIAAAQPQFRSRPTVKDGHIAINGRDLSEWITRTGQEPLSPQKLSSRLSAIGAYSKRVTGKHPEQSRWLLPVKSFDPANWRKARLEAVQKEDDSNAA